MRTASLITLIAGLLAAPARGQTATEWLDRWARSQGDALASVRTVAMTEEAEMTLESAHGARTFGSTTRFTFGQGTEPPLRELLELTIDGKPIDRPPPDRRRRYENPLEGMQPSVDLLLFPTRLLRAMAPPDDDAMEEVEFDGRSLVSIRTRARQPDAGVARAIWWIDPTDGRLVQARTFVQGAQGGALEAFVRYQRIQGLDLPVRKRVEGSFPHERRMRRFTVLVNSRSDVGSHELGR